MLAVKCQFDQKLLPLNLKSKTLLIEAISPLLPLVSHQIKKYIIFILKQTINISINFIGVFAFGVATPYSHEF